MASSPRRSLASWRARIAPMCAISSAVAFFAERAAADAQLRHQLALGRKQIARLQRAVGDQAADLLGDLFVAADLADRLEPGGDRRSAAGGHWSDLSEV